MKDFIVKNNGETIRIKAKDIDHAEEIVFMVHTDMAPGAYIEEEGNPTNYTIIPTNIFDPEMKEAI